jgi:hypothetical protein
LIFHILDLSYVVSISISKIMFACQQIRRIYKFSFWFGVAFTMWNVFLNFRKVDLAEQFCWKAETFVEQAWWPLNESLPILIKIYIIKNWFIKWNVRTKLLVFGYIQVCKVFTPNEINLNASYTLKVLKLFVFHNYEKTKLWSLVSYMLLIMKCNNFEKAKLWSFTFEDWSVTYC